MKKLMLFITGFAIVTMTLSSSAFAYTILGNSDFGELDSLSASYSGDMHTNQNSRDFVLNILSSPDYYSIQKENNLSESINHFSRSLLYLLQINPLTEWAVADLSKCFSDNVTISNIGKLTRTGGGSGGNVNPVPEPGTWVLVGAGLAGLGILKRKKKA